MKKKASARQKKITPKKSVSTQSAKKSRRVVKAVKPAHKASLKKVGFSLRSLNLGMHLVIAGSAVGTMMILGAINHDLFSTRSSDAQGIRQIIKNTATIGLEYTRPSQFSMLVGRKLHAGYITFSNDSTEAITINVPSDWKLLEVSGTSLSAVITGVPTFGFTSRLIPARANLKFESSNVPDAIFFTTPSEATAAITIKTVDLSGETSTADSKVVLLKSKNLFPLWVQG